MAPSIRSVRVVETGAPEKERLSAPSRQAVLLATESRYDSPLQLPLAISHRIFNVEDATYSLWWGSEWLIQLGASEGRVMKLRQNSRIASLSLILDYDHLEKIRRAVIDRRKIWDIIDKPATL